jgi:hypothetical protein
MSITVVSATQPEVKAEEKAASPVSEPAKAATQEEISDESGTSDQEQAEGKEAGGSKDADEGDAGESKDKPKGNGVQKRFSTLTKQREQAKAAAEAARAEAAYWKEQAEKASKAKEEPKPATKAEGEPNPDDFDSHAEYVKAVVRFENQQARKADEEKQREESLKSEQQKTKEASQERFKAFAAKTEDFDEVMEACEVPLSFAVTNIITRSKDGPELAYALAKDPELLEQICAMDAMDAAVAIGEFRASKLKAPEKQEIKQTKAPAPIRPVGGSAAAPKEKTLKDVNAETSQAEYEAIRAKQLARKQA